MATRRWMSAVLTLVIAASLFGTGDVVAGTSPYVFESNAAVLHARWAEMVTDGVPVAQLGDLESEWIDVERTHVLGVSLAFWRPDSGSIIDRWVAETNAIWDLDLVRARLAAIQAEARLRRALPVESAAVLKARALEIEESSTPASLIELGDGWNLEATLIPIDGTVAAEVGRVAILVSRAKGLGIVSDPGPADLREATSYASDTDRERVALAPYLERSLRAVQSDLAARVAAASGAKSMLDAVQGLIQLAGQDGVRTTSFQAMVDAQRAAYSRATTAAQFAAIKAKAGSIAPALHASINAAIAASRPAAPRPVAPVVNQGQVHIIQGVTFYYQTHALSCEETAMSMALTHQGIHLSQNQILAQLGSNKKPQYYDAKGILHWGDPYVSFVGNVNGIENVTGLQANYTALVRVAKANGARVIAAGNLSAATIYSLIAAGHPVVVYATWDWRWHPRHDYVAFDGRRIPFIGPAASHVYVAVGVRSDAVLVNDPIRGQYWVPKPAFQAAYSDFTEAIAFA